MTFPVVALGDVAETALGKMLDKAKTKGHRRVPYLRNVNVQWGRIDTDDLLTMELPDDDRDRFAVREGDLLVCEGGDIGRCAIWHGRTEYLAYQKALHRIRPSDELDTLYLRYLLEHHSLNGQLAKLATGTTIAHLPQQQLRKVPVPLPPIDEQHRIVNVLEDHLSRLDAAGQEVARAIDKLDALWRSALTATRGSFSAAPRATIGELASTSLGKMLDAKKQSGEPTPYLRNINVRWGSFDLVDLQTTPLRRDEVARFDVRDGDIMVCEGGEPGRCAIWRGDGSGIAFQKAIHRVRIEQHAEVHPEFLALMLEECVRSGRADRLFTGTTIKHLPQEKLRTIEIVLPSVDDQHAALQRLAEVAEARGRFRSSLIGTTRTSRALRRSLLAAAFSGRLTSDASDHWRAAKEMIDV